MAFGFFGYPARFSARRTYQFNDVNDDELFAVVKLAFENLDWLAYTIDKEKVFHKFLQSPMTWGEELTVKILSGGVIEAESKCDHGKSGNFMMLFDFGANRKNVETFFAQIECEIKARH